MKNITHEEMVLVLTKSGQVIQKELSELDCHLIHMVLGISGEAGELLDAVKKATIYRKSLDRQNIVEELGDLEFYMEGLRTALGITREETLTANIAKLSVRYKVFQYTNQAAIERKDKT